MGQSAAGCTSTGCRACGDAETTIEFDAAASSSSRGVHGMRWDTSSQAPPSADTEAYHFMKLHSKDLPAPSGVVTLGVQPRPAAASRLEVGPDLPSPPSHTVRDNGRRGARAEAANTPAHTLLQARLPLRFDELKQAARGRRYEGFKAAEAAREDSGSSPMSSPSSAASRDGSTGCNEQHGGEEEREDDPQEDLPPESPDVPQRPHPQPHPPPLPPLDLAALSRPKAAGRLSRESWPSWASSAPVAPQPPFRIDLDDRRPAAGAATAAGVPAAAPGAALLRAKLPLPLPLAQVRAGAKAEASKPPDFKSEALSGSTQTPQVTSSVCSLDLEVERAVAKKLQGEEIVRVIRWEREAREKVRVFLASHGFKGPCARKQRIMGYTYPLHTAVLHNDAAMVQMLLKAGADPRQTDSTGRTPYQLALSKEDGFGSHAKALNVLSTAGARREASAPVAPSRKAGSAVRRSATAQAGSR